MSVNAKIKATLKKWTKTNLNTIQTDKSLSWGNGSKYKFLNGKDV